MWIMLTISILLLVFSGLMLWRELSATREVSFLNLIFFVWLPGLLGGLMFTSFWILLIVSMIKKV
jgi:hypothetical protein